MAYILIPGVGYATDDQTGQRMLPGGGYVSISSSSFEGNASGTPAAVTLTAPTATASSPAPGEATGDLAPVSLSAPQAAASGGAGSTGAPAAISLTAPTATASSPEGGITFGPLKNNTGTLLASETGATVHVYALGGALVVTKASVTSNASGMVTVSDATIGGATQYRLIIVLASGAEGMVKVTST